MTLKASDFHQQAETGGLPPGDYDAKIQGIRVREDGAVTIFIDVANPDVEGTIEAIVTPAPEPNAELYAWARERCKAVLEVKFQSHQVEQYMERVDRAEDSDVWLEFYMERDPDTGGLTVIREKLLDDMRLFISMEELL